MMKGLDMVVALWIASRPERGHTTYAALGEALGVSASQAHDAVQRLVQSQLLGSKSRRIDTHALMGFLEHGLRFVFPAQPGRLAVGVPTAHSASPLRDAIRHDDEYVWPHDGGGARGQSIPPLHKVVPKMAMGDASFHEVLALADALRVGRARERSIALEELRERICPDGP